MQQSSATDAPATSQAADGAKHDHALGAEFAEALGRKDFDAVMALLDPSIDFRGLTPGRAWEASDADSVVEGCRHGPRVAPRGLRRRPCCRARRRDGTRRRCRRSSPARTARTASRKRSSAETPSMGFPPRNAAPRRALRLGVLQEMLIPSACST